MFSNYPPGAALDKNAPYNQKEVEPYPWEAHVWEKEECHHCGSWALVDDNTICKECYEEYDECKQWPEEE